jgi:hypothetical protein
LWLLRISYFSQVGLFSLTIFGFYYTVIPLYQKAVLDEAIAMKEIELKAMQKSLEADYSEIRGYVVNQFVFSAGAECTGLLIRIEDPSTDQQSRSNEKSWISETLDLDSAACLRKMFTGNGRLKQLRKTDYLKLSSSLERLAEHLDNKRKLALQAYKDLPDKAKIDPSILPQVTGRSASMIDTLKPYISIKQYQESLYREAVNAARLKIAVEYGNYARNNIRQLQSLDWKQNE